MYSRLLVPLDGSSTAECGLREAIALAGVHRAQIRLVHVLDTYPPFREGMESMLEEARRRSIDAGVAADIRVLDPFDGPLHQLVLAEARSWNAALIVMGTHGRKGFSRLALGSDAEQVARNSSIPVLLVPPAQQDEPGTDRPKGAKR